MLDQIRTKIVEMLRAIPEIGIVHERERYFSDLDKIRATFIWQPPTAGSPKQVRGWFLRRVKMNPEHLGNYKYDLENTWEITGYMSWNEELNSEIVFDGLIEQISQVFQKPIALNQVQNATKQGVVAHGIELVDSSTVTFTGVVCHRATLQLVTKHKS